MKKATDDRQIGSILNNLIRAKRFSREKKTQTVQRGPVLTTLGVPLMEQRDGQFFIDLTSVRVFASIPGFVGYLAKQTLENCRKTTMDVLTQVVVDADSTPELAALGVGHVVLYARGTVARHLVEAQQHFLDHLRLVFDALQIPQWGKLVFPHGFGTPESALEDHLDARHRALHFPFYDETGQPNTYFFLLEYDGKGAILNISMGNPRKQPDMQAHLKRMPHLLQTVQQANLPPLNTCRILLIHHATSEVLGFVKALQEAQCPAVTTLFIRYRGIVPEAL